MIVTNSILRKVYKPRKKESHKGDYGRLLIIGGNEKYSGSPAFNAIAGLQAMSSYRSGTDIVEVIAPKRVADIIAGFSPDIITLALKGDHLKKEHIKILLKESGDKTAFVIGGGLGREQTTLSAVRDYLRKTKLRGVIDADAIYAIRNSKINLRNFVITPHACEFKILTGKTVLGDINERMNQVKESAKKLDTTILLKGHIDIISDGSKIAINKTGNPYMTVGGTGDTLAGILGSLIAQGNSLFDSACAAAYINGKAGELTRKKSSLVASDLLENIGKIADSV
jgi:NAD(P)H-hydrate epimerase